MAHALSAFDLTDPNGDWRLFVNDDASDKVGFMTNRFALAFATRPKARVAFTESAVQVTEGAARTLTLTRSGPASLGAGAGDRVQCARERDVGRRLHTHLDRRPVRRR